MSRSLITLLLPQTLTTHSIFIQVSTAAALADYFAGITTSLAEVETEDSWQRLDKALAKLEAITKGGGYKFEEYIGHMKSIAQPICNSVSGCEVL